MSLNQLRNNLTKTTAVAAVIGIATCLFPAIAQAQEATPTPTPTTQPTSRRSLIQSIQFSGNPNEEAMVSRIGFTLDNSVEDSNLDPDLGEFPGAIQNLSVDSEEDSGVPDLFLQSGTLKTSRLTFNANGDVDPIIVDYSDQNNIDNIRLSDLLSPDYTSNEWLRYDVTFPDSPATLTLFLPSNDPNLINSLSGFNNFSSSNPPIQAVVSRPDVGRVESRTVKVVASNPDLERKRLTFVAVPEPTATASLLGIGALGAVTLLKRNKRLRKPL